MAVSAFGLNILGTPKSWKASGGDYAITLTSLADAAARQGAKGDLGEYFRQRWAVHLAASLAVAATTGKLLELWWSSSPSATAGTENAGGASGADAAYTAAYRPQLQFIGFLYLANGLGTGIQRQDFEFMPRFRYGMPVIYNGAGQALGATAADHEIRFTPVDQVSATSNAG